MPKILIVEDNPENWDMLSRRLKRRGFDVALAPDGLQGVAMSRTESPDLILMDMNLPGLDGWEATRQIRAAAQTKAIPIIALTAHGMPTDKARSLEVGCDDHHTKPVDLTALLAQIEALLAGRRASGSS
ncbi:MAG TPA: response regulator [Isosphaeraceae bacterium]|jgi:CheY-like chemotaxis protein